MLENQRDFMPERIENVAMTWAKYTRESRQEPRKKVGKNIAKKQGNYT